MTNPQLRALALTNIQAAEKVIRYNQQFLDSSDISSSEKRLFEIEKAISGNIKDCDEIIKRLTNQLISRNREDFGYRSAAQEKSEWELKKKTYEHCLRIVRGEQKI